MNPKRFIQYLLAASIILLAIVIVGAFFLPWRSVNWGTFALQPARTVTVVGEAKTEEQNKKASFSAGVNVVKDKKEDATAEVNAKITAIIDTVKGFGVKEEDIKTQNLSIYQEEETYTEGGKQKRRPGQWRVNNSVEIILRDVAGAGAFADLLSKAGANNVYGPNFTLEDNPEGRNALLAEAVADARKKAEFLARGAGKRLGSIISMTEGSASQDQYRPFEGAGGGGGADLQPGSETVRKTVSVTFALLDPPFFQSALENISAMISAVKK